MKFLFKYPTRSRPDWFMDTLTAYYRKLSGRHEYRFVIALDNDDETMNNQQMRNWLNNQKHIEYFYADHANKIQACNTGIPDDEWDIIVLISDDMTPITPEFDNVIAGDMKDNFPDLDGVLHYWDGLTGQPVKEPGITAAPMTCSIMGRKFYDMMGFVYWPSYEGQWCDNDVTDLAKLKGKYWFSNDTIIRHDWKKHEKYSGDDNYTKGCSTYQSDKAAYEWRAKRNFPVSFSQGVEDYDIRKYFKDVYKGRFLDIGAADGVTFSNTRILYDMGFNGVAVEPSPNFCKALAENCPRVKIVQAALTDKDGPVELYHTPDFTSTLSESHKSRWEKVTQYTKLGVDGICWNTLMAEHGTDFDFINLDIEGQNVQAFKNMPFEYMYAAKMFCIEYDDGLDLIRGVLQSHGFRHLFVNGENLIMVK